MRAGIYLRISQDRTGSERGVTRQREDCEALAARRGWDVHDVYIDNDVSAKGHRARPEWERMMADVEAGRLQVVIGWTVDRTLRSGRDRLRMLESGKEHSITIALVRGSDMDLSTPAGRLAADILGAVALNEIEVKADRQRRANEQAALQGRWVGGRRPFGYKADGTTPNPPEDKAVVAAFNDYLAGVPISAIARRWNEAGLLSGMTRKDGTPTKWTHSGVRNLLRNPRYAGLRHHNPGARSTNVRERRIVGKAEWPPLVPEATYRAVVALLDSAARKQKPHGGRRLLTGVATCSTCEEPISAGGGRAGGPQLYRCPAGHVVRRAEPVEEFISKVMVRRLQQDDVKRMILAAEDDGTEAALTDEAERLREEMDTIALERTQQKITPRQFTLMNTELVSKLADVERRMAVNVGSTALREFLAGGVTPERWDELGVDKQRVFVAKTLRIQLHPVGRGVRNPPVETIEVTLRTDERPV